jgi:hypothetical protein
MAPRPLVEREAKDGSTPGAYRRLRDRNTCFTAPVAAAMLGYTAHFNFGLSRQEICTPAVVVAIVIATFVSIDFFFKRLRRP